MAVIPDAITDILRSVFSYMYLILWISFFVKLISALGSGNWNFGGRGSKGKGAGKGGNQEGENETPEGNDTGNQDKYEDPAHLRIYVKKRKSDASIEGVSITITLTKGGEWWRIAGKKKKAHDAFRIAGLTNEHGFYPNETGHSVVPSNVELKVHAEYQDEDDKVKKKTKKLSLRPFRLSKQVKTLEIELDVVSDFDKFDPDKFVRLKLRVVEHDDGNKGVPEATVRIEPNEKKPSWFNVAKQEERDIINDNTHEGETGPEGHFPPGRAAPADGSNVGELNYIKTGAGEYKLTIKKNNYKTYGPVDLDLGYQTGPYERLYYLRKDTIVANIRRRVKGLLPDILRVKDNEDGLITIESVVNEGDADEIEIPVDRREATSTSTDNSTPEQTKEPQEKKETLREKGNRWKDNTLNFLRKKTS